MTIKANIIQAVSEFCDK